jgi:PAS domain S-box-containing protein
MVVTDCHTIILRVNGAFSRITGYGADEVVGRKSACCNQAATTTRFTSACGKACKELGAWQGEIWNRRKNGEIYPEWLSISAVLADDGSSATTWAP